MKKILALLLTAVMIMAFSNAAFAAPAEPEVQTGAALNAAAEELTLAEELLKKLPGSGVFEYLAGEPVQADAALSGATITETGNGRELSFEEGYFPGETQAVTLSGSVQILITEIAENENGPEIAFSYTSDGVKTDYRAQIQIRDVDGARKCVLKKIRRDQPVQIQAEAVSEVFEDYYEEVIEPLYSPGE